MTKNKNKFKNLDLDEDMDDDFPSLDSLSQISESHKKSSGPNNKTSNPSSTRQNPYSAGYPQNRFKGERSEDDISNKDEWIVIGSRNNNTPNRPQNSSTSQQSNTRGNSNNPSRYDNRSRRSIQGGRGNTHNKPNDRYQKQDNYRQRKSIDRSSMGSSRSIPSSNYQSLIGPTNVLTNHYQLDLNCLKKIHMFSIIYDPQVDHKNTEKELNQDFLDHLKSEYSNIMCISDGSRLLYTVSDKYTNLNMHNYTINKYIKNKQVHIKISTSFVKTLDLHQIISSANEELFNQLKTALEIIIKNSQSNVITLGRGSYKENEAFKLKISSTPFEAWQGWQQKVFKSTISEHLYLNIDLTFTSVILRGTLIDALQSYMGPNDILNLSKNNRLIQNFEDYFKGVSVSLTHLHRTKKICQIVDNTSKNYLFTATINGKEQKVNVVEYFFKVYGVSIKYPDYPLVQLAPLSKKTYLPMELLLVKTIQRRGMHDEKVTRELIRLSACEPKKRYDSTNKLVNDNFSKKASSILSEIGLCIVEGMLSVKGEIISAPVIKLGKLESEFPQNGKWNIQQKTHFFQPVCINKWLIMDFSKTLDKEKIIEFAAKLVSIAGNHGMRISSPLIELNRDINEIKSPAKIKNFIHQSAPNLVVFICPNYLQGIEYGIIKSIGDILEGVATQVILEKNVIGCKVSTINNIILKLNAKSGGINFVAEYSSELRNIMNTSEELMIMGIDVTHPISGNTDTSVSIASVVSSIDIHACKYTNQVVVNRRGNDILTTLKENIKISLNRYLQEIKKLPKRIIIFRDGLSEGQFLKARQQEVEDLLSGCSEYYQKHSFKPKLTFICVQKRHHTRFYSKDASISNCSPGLVVSDKRICEENSFYLLSHTSFQGTCKASHYKVIYDDSRFLLSELQKFAFLLCHCYARCSLSVSLPTPTYYAHLSAFRSNFHKAFCETYNNEVKSSKKYLTENLSSGRFEEARNSFYKSVLSGITPHQNLIKSMYFI